MEHLRNQYDMIQISTVDWIYVRNELCGAYKSVYHNNDDSQYMFYEILKNELEYSFEKRHQFYCILIHNYVKLSEMDMSNLINILFTKIIQYHSNMSQDNIKSIVGELKLTGKRLKNMMESHNPNQLQSSKLNQRLKLSMEQCQDFHIFFRYWKCNVSPITIQSLPTSLSNCKRNNIIIISYLVIKELYINSMGKMDEIVLDPSNVTNLINKYKLDGKKLIDMESNQFINIAKLYHIQASHADALLNGLRSYHNQDDMKQNDEDLVQFEFIEEARYTIDASMRIPTERSESNGNKSPIRSSSVHVIEEMEFDGKHKGQHEINGLLQMNGDINIKRRRASPINGGPMIAISSKQTTDSQQSGNNNNDASNRNANKSIIEKQQNEQKTEKIEEEEKAITEPNDTKSTNIKKVANDTLEETKYNEDEKDEDKEEEKEQTPIPKWHEQSTVGQIIEVVKYAISKLNAKKLNDNQDKLIDCFKVNELNGAKMQSIQRKAFGEILATQIDKKMRGPAMKLIKFFQGKDSEQYKGKPPPPYKEPDNKISYIKAGNDRDPYPSYIFRCVKYSFSCFSICF